MDSLTNQQQLFFSQLEAIQQFENNMITRFHMITKNSDPKEFANLLPQESIDKIFNDIIPQIQDNQYLAVAPSQDKMKSYVSIFTKFNPDDLNGNENCQLIINRLKIHFARILAFHSCDDLKMSTLWLHCNSKDKAFVDTKNTINELAPLFFKNFAKLYQIYTCMRELNTNLIWNASEEDKDLRYKRAQTIILDNFSGALNASMQINELDLAIDQIKAFGVDYGIDIPIYARLLYDTIERLLKRKTDRSLSLIDEVLNNEMLNNKENLNQQKKAFLKNIIPLFEHQLQGRDISNNVVKNMTCDWTSGEKENFISENTFLRTVESKIVDGAKRKLEELTNLLEGSENDEFIESMLIT